MKPFLERGQEAEQIAVRYLESRGFCLIEQNFRCSCGEIDLIMSKEKNLYFVEVKGRWTRQKGEPLEQVTPRKMRQISRVAEFYLHQNPLRDDQRAYLSVIGIDKSLNPEKIQWVPDAFDVCGSRSSI